MTVFLEDLVEIPIAQAVHILKAVSALYLAEYRPRNSVAYRRVEFSTGLEEAAALITGEFNVARVDQGEWGCSR